MMRVLVQRGNWGTEPPTGRAKMQAGEAAAGRGAGGQQAPGLGARLGTDAPSHNSEGTNPAGTLVLDLELQKGLLWKPLSVWHCAKAALASRRISLRL